MTTEIMIGFDLAKSGFQVHGASMTGQVKFRKTLSRLQFRKFMAQHPVATVILEACGSANYWAREITLHGYVVKLIAPQYVRPFVTCQKNDAADAEAIVIAAQRPEMRFVNPKMEDQQAKALLFGGKERLVRQRTELDTSNYLGLLLCGLFEVSRLASGANSQSFESAPRASWLLYCSNYCY